MATFVTFIVSLALLVFLFALKNWEISSGRKIFLEDFFARCDDGILRLLLKIKFWWSHVSFKNTKRVAAWLIIKTKKSVIAFKRQFDHEQSHFFTKREPEIYRSKRPVSFFLKDVADYKKSLREGKTGREIEN